MGKEVSNKTIFRLDDYLNEVYPLPYFFDIIQYDLITNEKLIEYINNEGKVIYTRDK